MGGAAFLHCAVDFAHPVNSVVHHSTKFDLVSMDGLFDDLEYNFSHVSTERSLVASHVALDGDEYFLRRHGESFEITTLWFRAALLLFLGVNLRRTDLLDCVSDVCHYFQVALRRKVTTRDV